MEHKTKRGRVVPSHQLVRHANIDWGPTVALVDKYAHVLSPQTRRPKDFTHLILRILGVLALMRRKRSQPKEEEGCSCRDPKLPVHVVEVFHQYNLLSLLVRWSDQKVEHNVEIDSDLHFGNDQRHKICTVVDDKIRIGCLRCNVHAYRARKCGHVMARICNCWKSPRPHHHFVLSCFGSAEKGMRG